VVVQEVKVVDRQNGQRCSQMRQYRSQTGEIGSWMRQSCVNIGIRTFPPDIFPRTLPPG